MVFPRGLFYGIWFWVFGVTAALATLTQGHALNSAWVGMFVTGLTGVLGGAAARPVRRIYDMGVGLLFIFCGGIDIAHLLHIDIAYRGTGALSGFFTVLAPFVFSPNLAIALVHIAFGLIALLMGAQQKAPTSVTTTKHASTE